MEAPKGFMYLYCETCDRTVGMGEARPAVMEPRACPYCKGVVGQRRNLSEPKKAVEVKAGGIHPTVMKGTLTVVGEDALTMEGGDGDVIRVGGRVTMSSPDKPYGVARGSKGTVLKIYEDKDEMMMAHVQWDDSFIGTHNDFDLCAIKGAGVKEILKLAEKKRPHRSHTHKKATVTFTGKAPKAKPRHTHYDIKIPKKAKRKVKTYEYPEKGKAKKVITHKLVALHPYKLLCGAKGGYHSVYRAKVNCKNCRKLMKAWK